ncbi:MULTISPECIES: metalloregulator ArsR/SmtB family transcription factor [Cryobacterium]|uniref:Metalloregulator ArsR/SmtB family transcription factor n=1 Tax=Cryobacterium sandaracinum TaxID=1259247 RepID=A0ABY2JEN8_9MICO|nr:MULTISPECIES: metalloregulator ArsR/SmtB family transcription factor [Cryobacterium]TFB57036.1 metalloregulator ArsR/SmtB family transcription factor [Cryobacterium sp. Sr3]TFD04024.1 metalloregulator ArsR/SmtB family transcription factor [Cryobacterium sandaracinum]
MGDREKKSALFEQFARVGKALGSGKRLELVDLLAQGERTVESLANAAGLGLTSASAHLQTLKHAGLVSTRREGTRIHYRLAGDDVARLYSLVRSVAQTHLADVESIRIAYLGLDDSEAAGDDTHEEITREELLARATAGTITVLDVRPRQEYNAAHIPGALSIPLEELSDRLSELPTDREVVAYCRGKYCVLAYEAMAVLRRSGRRATRLNEGMLEWRLANLPVSAEAAAGRTSVELPACRTTGLPAGGRVGFGTESGSRPDR